MLRIGYLINGSFRETSTWHPSQPRTRTIGFLYSIPESTMALGWLSCPTGLCPSWAGSWEQSYATGPLHAFFNTRAKEVSMAMIDGDAVDWVLVGELLRSDPPSESDPYNEDPYDSDPYV